MSVRPFVPVPLSTPLASPAGATQEGRISLRAGLLATALALFAFSAEAVWATPITSPADPLLVGAEAISMPTTGVLPKSVATTGFGTVTYSGNFFHGFLALGATSGSTPGEFLDISWTGGPATAIAFELVNINLAATLDVFDSANQLVESHSTPFGPATNVFFFGAKAADIGRVRITSNDSIGVRNLLLNDAVPEPTTALLLAAGLAGLAVRGCRRRS